MPLQQALPTWVALNATNSPSPSGLVDLRTGTPQMEGGLNVGDYFDLTEAEANALSNTVTGTLHEGRYRLVQVDAGATAANVKVGTVGAWKTAAAGPNVVTSYDLALSANLIRCVFLNSITPGNYGFVQEMGDATTLGAAAIGTTPAVGNYVLVTTAGVVTAAAAVVAPTQVTLGKALTLPANSTLFRTILDLPTLQG